MNTKRFILDHNFVQSWTFKVFLLLSVFTFSGFNVEVHDGLYQSYSVELIDNRSSLPIFDLSQVTKEDGCFAIQKHRSKSKMFLQSSQCNVDRQIAVKLKMQSDKIRDSYNTSIRVPLYIPSALDEEYISIIS